MKYFFHEDWQLEMVAKCCPFIEKMLFIFHEDCVQDYLVLNPFENLKNLELFGGKFYTDKICELIQIKGSKLDKLTLLSIKEIDFKAFAILSLHGKNLTHLNINNCEIVGKVLKTMSRVTEALKYTHDSSRSGNIWKCVKQILKQRYRFISCIRRYNQFII